MQPPDGQSVQDLVKHADQGVIWSTIGWIIGGLASLVVALLGYLGVKEAWRTSTLFEWKDNTVDPFMTDVPKLYATKKDIEVYIFEPNRKDHDRILDKLEDQDKLLLKMHGMLIDRAKREG